MRNASRRRYQNQFRHRRPHLPRKRNGGSVRRSDEVIIAEEALVRRKGQLLPSSRFQRHQKSGERFAGSFAIHHQQAPRVGGPPHGLAARWGNSLFGSAQSSNDV